MCFEALDKHVLPSYSRPLTIHTIKITAAPCPVHHSFPSTPSFNRLGKARHSSIAQTSYNTVAVAERQQPQPITITQTSYNTVTVTPINVRTSGHKFQHAYTNALPVNNTMTNTLTLTLTLKSALSPSSPQTTLPLTAAALAAHQRTMAANPSTTSPRGAWVCGGQMYHRPTPPSDKRWRKLVKKDDLAADIDEILRAATGANEDEGN